MIQFPVRKAWNCRLTAEVRPSLAKDFAAAFQAVKCSRDTGLPQLGYFCFKLNCIETRCAKVARSLLHDAAKSIIDRKCEEVLVDFNGTLQHAHNSVEIHLRAYAAKQCNMSVELGKLSADSGMLDDAALQRFLSVGQGGTSKQLYQ